MASAIVGAQSARPQTIRVSDLISADPKADLKDAGGKAPAGGIGRPLSRMDDPKPAAASSGSGSRIAIWAELAVILALAGLSAFLYFQNGNLASQVASVAGKGANVASQVSSLQGQVSALDASNTALAAQESSLSAENTDLLANLSFVAVPAALSAGGATPAATTTSVSGTLTKGRLLYILTTSYGITAYVKNSSDPSVAAALAPLAGGTTTVSLSGMHVPGSAYLTVSGVNGVSISATSSAASSTASSSPAQAK